ncbi:MAG: acetylornithine deacetylase [Pirellulaceae bacterium]|jgi:acetylornithine deacetylase
MDAISYAKSFVEINSISRWTNGPATDWVKQQLHALGFDTERIEYDDENGERKSSVVGKRGEGRGGLAYFGHSDVVPADTWVIKEHGPFEPTVKDGRLYGRGSCDMKGSISAFLAAAARTKAAAATAPVYFVCTADEEIGYGGARTIVEQSKYYREMVEAQTRVIIGEPTQLQVVYAHKGTFGFFATARGVAAHSSTRNGLNANLAMIPFLMEMKAIHDETEAATNWHNNEFDPPTITWNIGINDHNHAFNITAPQSVCTVYYRPMPNQEPEKLLERAERAAKKFGIDFEVKHRNQPMYTSPDNPFVKEMVELTGSSPASTVPYGTDGSWFRELENKVVFGPGSIAQAHTHDEWLDLDQLEKGTDIYEKLIRHWTQ